MKSINEFLLSKKHKKWQYDDFETNVSPGEIKDWAKRNKIKFYNSFMFVKKTKSKFSCSVNNENNNIRFDFKPNDYIHQMIVRNFEGCWSFTSYNKKTQNVKSNDNIKFKTVLEIIHKMIYNDSEPINFNEFI